MSTTREQILARFTQWWDESDDISNDGPWEPDSMIQFAWAGYNAAIQQYKDSLLKGVGEPVAYMTTDEEGSASMLFFDRAEALKYSGDDEPIKLIVKPGE